jgi:hypothetical protein
MDSVGDELDTERSQGLGRLGTHARVRSGVEAPEWSGSNDVGAGSLGLTFQEGGLVLRSPRSWHWPAGPTNKAMSPGRDGNGRAGRARLVCRKPENLARGYLREWENFIIFESFL